MDIGEYKDMFLSETSEHLQQLNERLLRLEKEPGDRDALKELFRSTHTIKGMAATMGYENITKLSHELETALDPYRKQEKPLPDDMIQITFEGLDLLEKLKDEVEEDRVGQIAIEDYLGRLKGAEGKASEEGTAPAKKEGTVEEEAKEETPGKETTEGEEAQGTPEEKEKAAPPELPPEELEEKPIPPDVMEYLDMFMSEAQEHLLSLNDNILKLEDDPGDMDTLAEVFRSSHTIKGMAATMGFTNMNKLTHELETALDFYRKVKRPLDQVMINVTFECLDKLEKLNEEIKDGKVGGVGIRDQMIKLGEIIRRNGPWQEAMEEEETPDRREEEAKKMEEEGGEKEEAKPPKPPKAGKKGKEDIKDKAEEKALKGTTSIRISIQNLESLMNLVGELVINKSRLMDIGSRYDLSDLREALGHIDRLTTDLQDEVLNMRMVPTRYIFNRFPRMVRDLARAEGKEVEFTVIGWDIELDRTVLDEISEPLVHLLRNSIDHGLERPEERERAGKPRKGTVRLVAMREKNHVKITVEDDGKGIDPEAIKKKAIEKELVDETKAEELTEQECINLLFLPGFSTSKKVTKVSGRGVGMDVVKTKIESLGGLTEMVSTKGKGTKTTLTLPLTMAIIRALLVRVGLETYAMPISMVIETGKFKRSQTKTVHGRRVIILRDEVVPLVDLHDVLNIEKGEEKEDMIVVFVERGEKKLGLLVDHLIGQQEIVIKPLGKVFQNIKGIAGATILGDGRVALILDIATLI